MANFSTHLTVASVASSMLASLVITVRGEQIEEAIVYFFAGALGGILPDIDSDNSAALKFIFTLFGVLISAFMMVQLADEYAIVTLWVICITSFLLVRFGLIQVFAKFTVHRGIFHSISSALFFWFSTTILCFHWVGLSALQSWLIGFFIFMGYTIHLLLDELYSVDLFNVRIKRSFGTAFKFVYLKSAAASLCMIVMILITFKYTPPIDRFTHLILSQETYQTLYKKFIPDRLL